MSDVLRPVVSKPTAAWKGMLIQPIAVLLILAAYIVWLSVANLSPTERATLNPGDLMAYTGQHLALTFVSSAIVLVGAIPLGVLLTRRPLVRISGVVLAIANFGQAAPAIGLVVLLAFWLGFGFWAAVVALVAYAALPVLRNTMATLATFIGAGGLGLLITTGVNLFLPSVLISGALLVALLALLIDWIGRVVEYYASPKGLR